MESRNYASERRYISVESILQKTIFIRILTMFNKQIFKFVSEGNILVVLFLSHYIFLYQFKVSISI